jgi:hypothetical protein
MAEDPEMQPFEAIQVEHRMNMSIPPRKQRYTGQVTDDRITDLQAYFRIITLEGEEAQSPHPEYRPCSRRINDTLILTPSSLSYRVSCGV